MEAVVFFDPLDVVPAQLNHDQRLDLLQQIEQTRSALDAQQQVTLALLAREGDAEWRKKEWVREEIAAALSIAPGTAAAKLCDAKILVHRLPLTLDRLADGSITMFHARAVIEAAADLPDDAVAELERRVVPKAADQAIGVFRQTVRRAALAADPRAADDKHRDAMAQRRVPMYPGEDGMATVWAYLRADAAMSLMTALQARAATLPDDERGGQPRTMDQKRADVLTDLADLASADAGGSWPGRRPAVQVSVALSTLLGIDQQPGELDGYGPIPAALARAIAADASSTWRRLITDPLGRLIRCGRTSYRPPAALRDHVIAESPTCTFPGCRRRSCNGEIDHITAWDEQGATDPDNLHPPCSRHHHTKHDAGWRVRKRGAALTWISPTGREYETPTHTYPVDMTMAADPDPPPF